MKIDFIMLQYFSKGLLPVNLSGNRPDENHELRVKQLILVRHAKSDWGDANISDHDRSLNERGLLNAPEMGKRLLKNGIRPQQILASSAIRAQETAKLIALTLDQAIGEHLDNRREPSRRVNELDTRGSHYYLALYWAQALSKQTQDSDLQARFTDVAEKLSANEDKILKEFIEAQGQPVDVGGYYHPNDELAVQAMRPSATLNTIVDAI